MGRLWPSRSQSLQLRKTRMARRETGAGLIIYPMSVSSHGRLRRALRPLRSFSVPVHPCRWSTLRGFAVAVCLFSVLSIWPVWLPSASALWPCPSCLSCRPYDYSFPTQSVQYSRECEVRLSMLWTLPSILGPTHILLRCCRHFPNCRVFGDRTNLLTLKISEIKSIFTSFMIINSNLHHLTEYINR